MSAKLNPPLLCLVLLALAFEGTSTFAQSSDASPADLVYRDRVFLNSNWFADADGITNRFWYRVNLADRQREFVLVDAGKGTREPAFDHARVATATVQVYREMLGDRSQSEFASLAFQ